MKKMMVLVLLVCCGAASAAPAPADYARSLGLREAWVGLTRNVAFPAQWRDDGRFYYRKTVEGGLAFLLGDPAGGAAEPAFDAVRLARALSRVSGTAVAPQRLPFAQFDYIAAGEQRYGAIQFHGEYDDASWRCTLADYVCAAVPEDAGRPRGLGVVRDLRVAVDNHPRRCRCSRS